MKNRYLGATLALCFLNSLALADSPTDAPLMNSDPVAIAAPDPGRNICRGSNKKAHRGRKAKGENAPPQKAQESEMSLTTSPQATTATGKE